MPRNIISMKDFFLKYRDMAISSNYCFKNKSFLIPKVPLERNIVKISDKKINTELGIVIFHKIRSNLWFGFSNHIAKPEKAVLDYLYFCLQDGRKPLAGYDITNLGILNKERLLQYSNQFPKTVKKYLNKLIKAPYINHGIN